MKTYTLSFGYGLSDAINAEDDDKAIEIAKMMTKLTPDEKWILLELTVSGPAKIICKRFVYGHPSYRDNERKL